MGSTKELNRSSPTHDVQVERTQMDDVGQDHPSIIEERCEEGRQRAQRSGAEDDRQILQDVVGESSRQLRLV